MADFFEKKISEDFHETELLTEYYVNQIIESNKQVFNDWNRERSKYVIKRNINKYDSRLGNCVIYKHRKFLGLIPYTSQVTRWTSVLSGKKDDTTFYRSSYQDQDIENVYVAAEMYLSEYIFNYLNIPYKQIKWDHSYSF